MSKVKKPKRKFPKIKVSARVVVNVAGSFFHNPENAADKWACIAANRRMHDNYDTLWDSGNDDDWCEFERIEQKMYDKAYRRSLPIFQRIFSK